MNIGDALRERRSELGKTQEQVAKDAEMNVTQYNGYERGRSTPSPATLPRIARALETTPKVLLTRVRVEKSEADHRGGDAVRRLRDQFRAQLAAELGVAPNDIAVRIEIL